MNLRSRSGFARTKGEGCCRRFTQVIASRVVLYRVAQEGAGACSSRRRSAAFETQRVTPRLPKKAEKSALRKVAKGAALTKATKSSVTSG